MLTEEIWGSFITNAPVNLLKNTLWIINKINYQETWIKLPVLEPSLLAPKFKSTVPTFSISSPSAATKVGPKKANFN